MKKFLVCMLIAAVGVTSAFAQGAKETSGVDESLTKVMDKGVFVLGLDDAFPPMGFRDENNEIVGFDIDLAKEVTKRMGVELKPQPIDWNSKEQELATGNIDCIWNGFTKSPAREKVMTFSDTYVLNKQVLVVKTDSSYQNLSDFAGKTVGLQGGSTASDALDSATDFKESLKDTVEFKDNLTALMDLNAGGVDGVILDLLVANDTIQRSQMDFRILSEGLSEEEYAIGFRKGDIALKDAVEEQLIAMQKDGTLATISTKWFGSDISVIGK
jgi:polar amino acid transport system substrate-binding protein